MVSIGIRSFFLLLILLLILLAYWIRPELEVTAIIDMEPMAALVVGIITTLIGAFVYRGIRPHSLSPYCLNIYFNKSKNTDGVTLIPVPYFQVCIDNRVTEVSLEMPRMFQRMTIYTIIFLASASTFSQREVALIQKFPQQIESLTGRTCEDKSERMKKAEERPECKLVIRAHQLGFADNLGDCGELVAGPPVWCAQRHKDEPYFHFAWRKLSDFGYKLATALEGIGDTSPKDLIRIEQRRAAQLAKVKLSELAGDERSKHFIILSLPKPTNWDSKMRMQALRPSKCLQAETGYPNKLPEPKNLQDLSDNLEMAFGHLLFDQRYDRTITNCKEYEFIWGQDPKICAKIVQNPQGILSDLGIVRKVKELEMRFEDKVTAYPIKQSLTPKDFISISCLAYGKTRNRQKVFGMKVSKYPLWFKVLDYPEIQFEDGDSIAAFHIASQLSAIRFRYTELQSQTAFKIEEGAGVSEDQILASDYRLTRLGFLEDTDVFLEPEWLMSRPDILEVYPYYFHLSHFVNTFRDNYAQGRGRL